MRVLDSLQCRSGSSVEAKTKSSAFSTTVCMASSWLTMSSTRQSKTFSSLYKHNTYQKEPNGETRSENGVNC